MAEVSPKMLMKAEKTAAQVFRKAGVETRWVSHNPTPAGNQASAELLPLYPDIQLRILPRAMAERFGLPAHCMGFAPGVGCDRQRVYVFFDRAQQLFQQDTEARQQEALRGIFKRHADMAEILGHIIAHEVGHLLGIDTHSLTGIMRRDWNSKDLRDAACGVFLFTAQQAEVIRTEASRRMGIRELGPPPTGGLDDARSRAERLRDQLGRRLLR